MFVVRGRCLPWEANMCCERRLCVIEGDMSRERRLFAMGGGYGSWKVIYAMRGDLVAICEVGSFFIDEINLFFIPCQVSFYLHTLMYVLRRTSILYYLF